MLGLATAFFCVTVAVPPASASQVLFDFETDAEITLWHDEGKTTLGADKKLERVDRFAASGNYSMRFWTPAWRPAEHGGVRKWPAFECVPPITDWSKYDRLVISIVNETSAQQKLMLFISDSKIATRDGLIHREVLKPSSHVQAVIDLRQGFAAKGVNPADIHVMHFFTEDPPEDMSVYLDRMLLLEPGETPPRLPASYLRQIASLQAGDIGALRGTLREAGARMREAASKSPAILRWMNASLEELHKRLEELESRLGQPDESVLDVPADLAEVRERCSRLENNLALRLAFERVKSKVQVPGARDDVIVGFASSMEKVLPRAAMPTVQIAESFSVSLARNEKESFQVVVLPLQRTLRAVSVKVSKLQDKSGRHLEDENIIAVPVGYVRTQAVPPYGSTHVGWWPDPILTFMSSVDIQPGDAQAFWVRIVAPKDQSPGVYRGKLEVMCDKKPAFSFGLEVRVHGFTLPDASPLPLAITFAPHDHPQPETAELQAQWRQSPEYPVNAWRAHKSEWAQFLADYYITIDSLYEYSGWAPAFEELKRLHDQGRLGVFNLGYFSALGDGEEALAQWRASVIGRLRPRYEKAKELGLLDHAYIYGCDEHPADQFPGVERAAAVLKAEFPEVPVMTTTYDHSFGLESVIKSVDYWCPLTPRFDVEKAAKARAQGKQVWWYICCGPHHPYPNMFVEYPAIDGRLLMGAMTAKYRPDGFLYYQISIWNSQKPIEKGPFTDWDPRSWTTYHGDGSWTCVGPNGTPLPTIRLENFRDGLEDYAYFRVLEATVAKLRTSGTSSAERAEWIKRAERALQIPSTLAASLTEYTHDPREVYSWRNRLAEVIEGAGSDVEMPW